MSSRISQLNLPGFGIMSLIGRQMKSTAAPPAPAAPAKDEHKHALVDFDIKADSINDQARTFSGLAATWDLDLGGDVIHQGAFKKTLKDWKRSRQPLPLLDSHQAWGTVRAAVGKMVEGVETDAGLECTFEVIDGPDGDEIWRRIKGGYVTSMSIGYRPVKVEYPTEEEARAGVYRHLKEVALREVSVVLYPMNPNAQIDAGSMKAQLAALEAKAAGGQLTAEEKAELSELQTQITKLLGDVEVQPDPKATDPAPAPEPPAKAELAHDDPRRTELDRKLTDARLRQHGTRARERSRA